MKWEGEKGETKQRKIMTRRGYRRFTELVNQERVSKIVESREPITIIYTRWEKKIMEIKRKCQRKMNRQQTSRKQKILMSAKRRIKKSSSRSKQIEKERRRLLTRHVERDMHEKPSRRIKETIESLRRNGGGVKEETFWEFRRKLTGKKEEKPHAMRDGEGNMVEEKEEIINMFQQFYMKLFQKKEIDEDTEQKVNKELREITTQGAKQQPMVMSREEIKKGIKSLKWKKAADKNGWKNEMIKEGGEEMEKSLEIIFNKIMEELTLSNLHFKDF